MTSAAGTTHPECIRPATAAPHRSSFFIVVLISAHPRSWFCVEIGHGQLGFSGDPASLPSGKLSPSVNMRVRYSMTLPDPAHVLVEAGVKMLAVRGFINAHTVPLCRWSLSCSRLASSVPAPLFLFGFPIWAQSGFSSWASSLELWFPAGVRKTDYAPDRCVDEPWERRAFISGKDSIGTGFLALVCLTYSSMSSLSPQAVSSSADEAPAMLSRFCRCTCRS